MDRLLGNNKKYWISKKNKKNMIKKKNKLKTTFNNWTSLNMDQNFRRFSMAKIVQLKPNLPRNQHKLKKKRGGGKSKKEFKMKKQ